MGRWWCILWIIFGVVLLLNALGLSTARQPTPQPAWMIFVSAHEGLPAIYRMHDQQIFRLTATNGQYESPSWSPDGQWVVYTALQANRYHTLMLKNPYSHRQTRLSTAFKDMGAPVWSPDSQWIAFAGVKNEKADIYRVRPDGSDLEQLTFADQFGHWSPAWSSDGEWIVYTQANERRSAIYRMRPDGSEPHQISSGSGDSWLPMWSPDSQWVLFLSDRSADIEIYKMRVDGSEVQQIGQSPSYTWYHRLSSAWTSDGIVLDIFRRGSWGVYRMKADGTQLEAVPQLNQENAIRASLSWSPVVNLAWNGWILVGFGFLIFLTGVYLQRSFGLSSR